MFTRLGPLSLAVLPRVPVPHVRGVPTIIQESVWLHHKTHLFYSIDTLIIMNYYYYYYYMIIVADCSTVFFHSKTTSRLFYFSLSSGLGPEFSLFIWLSY